MLLFDGNDNGVRWTMAMAMAKQTKIKQHWMAVAIAFFRDGDDQEKNKMAFDGNWNGYDKNQTMFR